MLMDWSLKVMFMEVPTFESKDKKRQYKDKLNTRFKSEFSMGIFDFERMADLLSTLNYYAVMSRAFHEESLISYYAVLKQIYKEFKPIVFPEIQEDIGKKFDEIEVKVVKLRVQLNKGQAHNFPIDLLKDLSELEDTLRLIRQAAGLGFPTVKLKSFKKQLDDVLRPRHDSDTETSAEV